MGGLSVSLALDHARRLPAHAATETAALIARMDVQPAPARIALIGQTIAALKASGVWERLDALYVMAAHDAQAARLNWIADQYDLTAVNGPAFTTDRGYNGDGSTSYLDSGFNPTSAPDRRFTRNNASMFLWSLTDLNNDGGISYDIGAANSTIARVQSSGVACRTNTPSGATPANQLSFPGLAGWSRPHSSRADTWQNGQLSVSNTTGQNSVLPNDAPFHVCGRAGPLFGVNQLAVAGWGENMEAPHWAALHVALHAWLLAVEAVE